MLVEDDEIHGEALHAPVFVRAKELANQADVIEVVHLHQHDRQVAGNSVRPEGIASAIRARQHVRSWTQRAVGENRGTSEALEQVGFVRRDAKMVQLDLRLGPREVGGALEGAGFVILVRQRDDPVAGGRHHRASSS